MTDRLMKNNYKRSIHLHKLIVVDFIPERKAENIVASKIKGMFPRHWLDTSTDGTIWYHILGVRPISVGFSFFLKESDLTFDVTSLL